MDVKNLIKEHEGCRLKPYKCTAGKLTIGWGRNIEDVGISQQEADYLFDNDLKKVQDELLAKIPWFTTLNEVRQAVLLDMAFNLGVNGLLKWVITLGNVAKGHYKQASIDMLNSKWAKQVPNRAKKLSAMMDSGKWPR